MDSGVHETYGLRKRVLGVKGCRSLGKKDMKLNSLLPHIEVDPETFVVKADGVSLVCKPLDALPLAQKYYLY